MSRDALDRGERPLRSPFAPGRYSGRGDSWKAGPRLDDAIAHRDAQGRAGVLAALTDEWMRVADVHVAAGSHGNTHQTARYLITLSTSRQIDLAFRQGRPVYRRKQAQ